MNWDQIEGNWKKVVGQVKSKWGELTDDEITQISGKKDQLIGSLQAKYGFSKEQAQREVEEFSKGCNC